MPKKILFYSESWGIGGIENLVMDLARNLDKDDYAMDIFSTWDSNDAYDEELRFLGTRRFTVFKGYRPDLLKRQIMGTKRFGQLLRQEHYDIVHINTMNGMGFTYSQAAKKQGIKTRMVHSHNSSFGEGHVFIKTLGHNFGKTFLGSSATIRLACSDAAGQYLFGKHPYTIIQNGIDTDKFAFSPESRIRIRKELKIDDGTLILGSLARIAQQKNPLFSLDVFAEIHQKIQNSVFVMIGSGDMEKEVKDKISSLNLNESVIRIPRTTSPQEYYSAFDILISPSFFEGFGLTTIEAQSAGLPVICSTAYPSEIILTDLVKRISLDAPLSEWVKEIIVYAQAGHDSTVNRTSYKAIIESKGYSSRNMVRQIEQIYQGA